MLETTREAGKPVYRDKATGYKTAHKQSHPSDDGMLEFRDRIIAEDGEDARYREMKAKAIPLWNAEKAKPDSERTWHLYWKLEAHVAKEFGFLGKKAEIKAYAERKQLAAAATHNTKVATEQIKADVEREKLAFAREKANHEEQIRALKEQHAAALAEQREKARTWKAEQQELFEAKTQEVETLKQELLQASQQHIAETFATLPETEQLAELPSDLRWVASHPRLAGIGSGPLTKSELQAAPSRLAVGTLAIALENPASFLQQLLKAALQIRKDLESNTTANQPETPQAKPDTGIQQLQEIAHQFR